MGKVYLVGAGPGEPDLITVRGQRILNEADIILYDRLVSLKGFKNSIYVGDMEQNEINKLVLGGTRVCDKVVRLKSGDPFIFGRGGEEMQFLVEQGIDVEIVPGVSSATGLPALAGIPLTHRDYASSVAIVTGHRKDEKEIQVPDADTLVYLMCAGNFEKIVEKIIEKRGKDVPCAIIGGSTSLTTGTLGEITKNKVCPPIVLVVGEVVKLKRKKILVTGTNPDRFRHLGEVVHQPLIKIEPLDFEIDGEYDWIVFTSKHGVTYFNGKNFCVIGKATLAELERNGYTTKYVPEKETTEGIIDLFKKIDIKGKKILLPRSNLADNRLPDILREMGAKVDCVIVYNTIMPENVEKLDLDQFDEIIFTSKSCEDNFREVYGNVPKDKVKKA